MSETPQGCSYCGSRLRYSPCCGRAIGLLAEVERLRAALGVYAKFPAPHGKLARAALAPEVKR